MGRVYHLYLFYDNTKYNVNRFIGHSVVLQYVTVHRVEQNLKCPNSSECKLDAMTSWICKLMWHHLPPQVSQNPVGNTGSLFHTFYLNNSNVVYFWLQGKPNLFWWVAVNTFRFMCANDMMRIVLLKWNGQMLMKWLEQFWRCSCIHHLLINETADGNITESLTRASIWVVNKTVRLRHSLTSRHVELIFK